MGDPMRKALVMMQGVFAELEKNMLVKKLRQARDRKREIEGRCGGRLTFTQETLPEALRSALVEIKKLRKVNPGQKRKSFPEVAEALNLMGLTTSQGRAFTGSNVQSVWQRYRKLI